MTWATVDAETRGTRKTGSVGPESIEGKEVSGEKGAGEAEHIGHVHEHVDCSTMIMLFDMLGIRVTSKTHATALVAPL